MFKAFLKIVCQRVTISGKEPAKDIDISGIGTVIFLSTEQKTSHTFLIISVNGSETIFCLTVRKKSNLLFQFAR
jgi:hypothetical protein